MRQGRLIRKETALAGLVLAAGLALTGCQADSSPTASVERIKSDPKESFSSKKYGVKASPRVTDLKHVRKGGGRDQIGRPYKVAGRWYYPKEQPGYVKTGKASWYGSSFHGRLTANGEVYDMFGLSAAHPTFPLPSYARVTNQDTGTSIVVRVNDRGPYHENRVMDLSSKAAEMLGYKDIGVGNVKVEYVGRAPLDGDDTPTLMASYRPGNAKPSVDDGLPSGVQIASNEAPSRLAFATSLTGRPVSGGAGAASIGSVSRSAAGQSIEDIIGMAAPASTAENLPPLPTPRVLHARSTILSSYAPAEPARRGGAVAALASLGSAEAAGERIELGTLADAQTLGALRDVVEGHGHLIADAGPDGTTYAVELAPGEDADAVLQAVWDAGATDAFVLRD